MGKEKQPDSERAYVRESAPLSSLRDPNSFGAPPKHVDYYGTSADAPQSPVRHKTDVALGPRRRQEEEEEKKPQYPQVPYRVDTTGLRTENLPKPPVHRQVREGVVEASSPSYNRPAPTAPKAKPSLPPRLPPRQPSPSKASAPGAVSTGLSPLYPLSASNPPVPERSPVPSAPQGAIDSLSNAGINVPGFGIGAGRNHNTSRGKPIQSASASAASPISANVTELQSRLAKMSTNQSVSENPSNALKPRLPPKRAILQTNTGGAGDSNHTTAIGSSVANPPPIPVGTKPK